MYARLTARQIWGMPMVIGLLSTIGLLSALLGDGIWDLLSWLSLALPLTVAVWHMGQ